MRIVKIIFFVRDDDFFMFFAEKYLGIFQLLKYRMSVIPKMPKNAKIFYCEYCDFKCSKQSNYNSHLMTTKHSLRIKGTQMVMKSYCCAICCKEYKSGHGLWYHKKKCEKQSKMPEKMPEKTHHDDDDNFSDKQLIKELLKQNNELLQKVMELASIPTTSSTITSNSHNKQQFNLNFFLNETCKNAMNMTDFIDSLQIETHELENVGKLGYVEGISKIFIRGLKELDETVRPMHCMDKKRETLYIKDNGSWNKDDNQEKVKEVIGKLGHKNFMKLMQWKQENPQHENSETKKHAQYTEMVKQVFTCITPDDDIGINKIIRKVANEVCVDKGAASLVL